MSDEKYYSTDKFVCHDCGREWDTPGAAESCWNRHRLMDVLERVYNHKKLVIGDVIAAIDEMVEAGAFDDERMLESAERMQERRSEVRERDVDQLKAYIAKLERAIASDWNHGNGAHHQACEWREFDPDGTEEVEWRASQENQSSLGSDEE